MPTSFEPSELSPSQLEAPSFYKGEGPAEGLELLSSSFNERYHAIGEIILNQFRREIKLLARAQAICALLLMSEALLGTALFVRLGASMAFAAVLAAIFLTTFASFVILIYLGAVRSHRLADLRDRLVSGYRQHLGYQEGRLSHHLTLAEMLSRLAMELSDAEYTYVNWTRWPKFCHPYLQAFSAWRYWRDIHNFRHLLLSSVIEESLALVRCDPLNIEVHSNLASAYVLMASLFCDPRRVGGHDFEEAGSSERWVPPARLSPAMEEQFRHFSARAVQEFNIIHDFAPHDPWVHAQLAYSYHDLKMPLEEIRSYEKLLELCPEDDDARFRLGLLYFQQGMHAQGLKMYETLRQNGYPKSYVLISFYGQQAPFAAMPEL